MYTFSLLINHEYFCLTQGITFSNNTRYINEGVDDLLPQEYIHHPYDSSYTDSSDE